MLGTPLLDLSEALSLSDREVIDLSLQRFRKLQYAAQAIRGSELYRRRQQQKTKQSQMLNIQDG